VGPVTRELSLDVSAGADGQGPAIELDEADAQFLLGLILGRTNAAPPSRWKSSRWSGARPFGGAPSKSGLFRLPTDGLFVPTPHTGRDATREAMIATILRSRRGWSAGPPRRSVPSRGRIASIKGLIGPFNPNSPILTRGRKANSSPSHREAPTLTSRRALG
jgi:hypothetical protein